MDRWRTKLRVIHHPPSIFISKVRLFNSDGYTRVNGAHEHDFWSGPVRGFENIRPVRSGPIIFKNAGSGP